MSLSDPDIEAIARGLLERTLPKAQWTHAAHFAAALWLLRRRENALYEMPGLIRAYNEATGVPNTDRSGYHETITLASLRAARAWLASRPPDEPLHRCLEALLAAEYGRPGWLLRYWSADLLFSVQARRSWVEPDREALPF